ncbi:hypothetical protein EJ05DRAFT_510917 [Pseudovirgaria hyperparasitica]|uniref:Uncharacterized protein n=1 Tax=Pseudovirgaria hyperparasitica TaxID=470096 RepID=A0A6A6W871_9PEZI|nr:uncharacterized protein EJ05DRAFT_510917 [Pseudovirgaria hyperparasitica]KAF2758086.1 hypothetical protein EJ05DRAFT_510917 [Pseudovirgaria hyperparasitica]
MSDPTKSQDKQGYTGGAKQYYNQQYESWYPWIEDQYLKWFTKDNKASYATKDALDKSKVTGIDQVDKLQDGVNGLVAGQVGKGGLAQPIGDYVSKEGVNRMERGGKDDNGEFTPGGAGDTYVNQAKGGVSSGASAVADGAKGVGGIATGWMGGQKEGEQKK